jgi:UDP-N-acetylmuramoyl-L-alanyl-D-glutamate--2,6-diaminopimelate ligase
MRLKDLFSRVLIKRFVGDEFVEIKGLQTDSRKVQPGDLFVCVQGLTVDGHRFAQDAVANGAVAVVLEKDVELPESVTKVFVTDSRRVMAIVADAFYGQPTLSLGLIGVTGTNGKTTITNLVEKILSDRGKKTGLIGTIHMRCGEYTEKTPNTTPEAVELQRYFRRMLDLGAQYAVIEVSSHALEQGRVRGCNFRTVIFTNLTHDHLDFHKTMESYRDAKGLLFEQLGNTYEDSRPKAAVLNADDEASAYYAKRTAAQVVTYGIHNEADVRAREIVLRPDGCSFVAETFAGNVALDLRMTGIFNVYNALAALAACLLEGLPLEEIKESLEAFEGVRGRFEPVYSGQNFSVIIDYAHNPDGLKNVLKTAKDFTKGRLICVVGCEGDRDREKRGVMATIAAEYADLAVLTSDNTRSEDPEAIVHEMYLGLVKNKVPEDRYVLIVDRRDAIQHALHHAREDDCIIIAGKGHETVQIVKDNQAIPFDDREVALEIMRSLNG